MGKQPELNRAGKSGQQAGAADTQRPEGALSRGAAEREARRAARKAEREAAAAARRAANQAAREAAREERRRKKAAEAADAVPDDENGAGRRSARRLEGRGKAGKVPAKETPAAGDKPAGMDARAGAQPAPSPRGKPSHDFDILVVAQGGGIDREAAFLAASLRRNSPRFTGRLVVAEPQPGGAWGGKDPRMSDAARSVLTGFGADIRPLHARDFGQSYPHGNKIEALALLDPDKAFLFLDSDTLVLDDIGTVPFDFDRPSASMRRTGTWPEPPAYKHTYDSIWRSLYDRFGLDMDTSLDLSQPEEHWERFLYFNAGWFFGPDAVEFGRRMRDWAVAIRDDPGEPLACQSLDPWLDQVVLPLVIHSLGGGRPGPELEGMDGDVTCHWRNLPLLYARESDRAIAEIEAIAALPEMAPLMEGWDAGERLIRDGLGRRRIRRMFAGEDPPAPEQSVRHRLRQADLWVA